MDAGTESCKMRNDVVPVWNAGKAYYLYTVFYIRLFFSLRSSWYLKPTTILILVSAMRDGQTEVQAVIAVSPRYVPKNLNV